MVREGESSLLKLSILYFGTLCVEINLCENVIQCNSNYTTRKSTLVQLD